MGDKKTLRQGILLITYAVVLYLGLTHLREVAGAAGFLLSAAFPVVAGFGVAYVLNLPMSAIEKGVVLPALAKIQKRRRPVLARTLSMLIVFLLFFAAIGGIIFFVAPDLVQSAKMLGQAVPGYVDRTGETLLGYLSAYHVPQSVIDELKGYTDTVISAVGEYAVNLIPQILSGIGEAASRVTGVVLCVIVAAYLLAGKESLLGAVRALMAAYMPERPRRAIGRVARVADSCFCKYITGQATEAVILGALCFIGMSLFRFPYPLLIGLLVGVSGLIPMFGAFLGAGLGAFLILMVAPGKVLWFILFYYTSADRRKSDLSQGGGKFSRPSGNLCGSGRNHRREPVGLFRHGDRDSHFCNRLYPFAPDVKSGPNEGKPSPAGRTVCNKAKG